MSAPTAYYFRNLTMPLVTAREAVKAVRTLLRILVIVPVLWQVTGYAGYAPGHWRDIPGLFLARVIQELAQTVGSFKGLNLLIRVEGWHR